MIRNDTPRRARTSPRRHKNVNTSHDERTCSPLRCPSAPSPRSPSRAVRTPSPWISPSTPSMAKCSTLARARSSSFTPRGTCARFMIFTRNCFRFEVLTVLRRCVFASGAWDGEHYKMRFGRFDRILSKNCRILIWKCDGVLRVVTRVHDARDVCTDERMRVLNDFLGAVTARRLRRRGSNSARRSRITKT